MTVIAWDGKSVAADSLCTFGGYAGPKPMTKIVRRGNRVYGITGLGAWFEAWIAWFERGADPRDIPVTTRPEHDTGNFLVFEGSKARVCSHGLPYLQEVGAPDAWGCACDFAIGAMKAGADAHRAVEIAIECSPHCQGPIVVLDPTAEATISGIAKKRARSMERLATQ